LNRRTTVSPTRDREFFIDNLLVRIHFIIVMIWWTGLAPWEFEYPFPGSLTSTFLDSESLVRDLTVGALAQRAAMKVAVYSYEKYDAKHFGNGTNPSPSPSTPQPILDHGCKKRDLRKRERAVRQQALRQRHQSFSFSYSFTSPVSGAEMGS